jgi:transposase
MVVNRSDVPSGHLGRLDTRHSSKWNTRVAPRRTDASSGRACISSGGSPWVCLRRDRDPGNWRFRRRGDRDGCWTCNRGDFFLFGRPCARAPLRSRRRPASPHPRCVRCAPLSSIVTAVTSGSDSAGISHQRPRLEVPVPRAPQLLPPPSYPRRSASRTTLAQAALSGLTKVLTRACPHTFYRSTLPSMETSGLTDAQWERLCPLLPPQKPYTGRPAKDHRTVLNGILWILRTGSPRRVLPERYDSWKTISSRFYRWQRAGVWDRVLTQVQRQADAEGRLDWSLHFVDSTVVRAHQHAAAAKGGPGCRGPGSESRRVQHEDPSPVRAEWQTDGAGADGW